METKPKIDFGKSKNNLEDDLTDRLGAENAYHNRNELVVSSILDMMLEKTKMYGGDDNEAPFNEKVKTAYYEGIGRKSKRLKKIIERVLEDQGDQAAKAELVDTLIDTAGYSIMFLAAIAEEVQGG